MHLTEHHYFGAREGFYGAVPHHHHVLTAASGGWWSGAKDARGIPAADAEDGSPNGYHMLTVEGAKYDTRFVPAAGKPGARLRASIERPSPGTPRTAPLSAADVQHGELVVNVFDGGPATRVRYGIAGVTNEPRPCSALPVQTRMWLACLRTIATYKSRGCARWRPRTSGGHRYRPACGRALSAPWYRRTTSTAGRFGPMSCLR